MASKNNLLDIGLAERPVYVPQKSLKPETDEGREWWGMVAEGSVVLKPEVLDSLLKLTKKPDDQKT